jgi:iron complex outermembrane recepter protein
MIIRHSLLAVIFAGVCAPAFAQQATPVSDTDTTTSTERVIVTGTRDAERTLFETLAPVDVLSEAAIQQSASNEVGDALAQIVPSFNVQRLPLADGLVFVRPATLRNLSPDQTLVLLNGKRLHRSALLGSRGAQSPDLGQVPGFGIKNIEVLRDGASAQYGSDAIAGVVNIILSDDIGFSGFAQYGQYYEGDGANYRVGGRGGMKVGEDGFLTVSAEYTSSDPTSRSRQRPDAIALQAANPSLNVPNPVQNWGQPELESFRMTANFATPINELMEVYAFGTYGQGSGLSDFNWRNPATTPSVFATSPIFPGFDVNTIYPAGFTPIFGQDDRDYQTVAGLRGGRSDGLSWDISASYGDNQIDYSLSNTINASLGPASPFSFKPGGLEQKEFNLNADFVYRWDVGLVQPLNVAFGAERRVETYKVKLGDPASYAIGPGAADGLAPNANGFPGFGPLQVGEWDQTSYAGYVDVEASFTDKWTVDGAIRYEDFSEFGNTTDYKLSSRYAFTDDLALRASYATGFRAPTPGQLFSTSTTQGLDTITSLIYNRGRLSPTDPLSVSLGAKPLTPENSESFSAGFVWRGGWGFSGSIDAYQVDVTDRFSQSATLPVPTGTPNPNFFTGVSFFVNAFDTSTKGVDVIVNYEADLGPGKFDAIFAYNHNETTVQGGTTSIVTNDQQRRVFEEGRPQDNATISTTYRVGPFKGELRGRYYGKWTDSTGNTTGLVFQEFGSISFIDASVSYDINDAVTVRVGAENVFDNYPEEATFQANRGLIYSRNAPYDTDGGQYYVRLDAKF